MYEFEWVCLAKLVQSLEKASTNPAQRWHKPKIDHTFLPVRCLSDYLRHCVCFFDEKQAYIFYFYNNSNGNAS